MPGHEGGKRGRADRWRARYWARLEEADTNAERLAVALDHARLVITKCVAPERQRAVTDALLAEIVSVAEAELTRYEQEGKKAA